MAVTVTGTSELYSQLCSATGRKAKKFLALIDLLHQPSLEETKETLIDGLPHQPSFEERKETLNTYLSQ